ncbi:MAG: hypothetical protein JRM90_02055, partial [Nitrososphaerota archaeon]|nr:hypothetical protein [Nitrososphaerota archaeon]
MVCSRDEADFRALPVQAPPRGPGRLGQGYATPLKSWRRFNDLEVRTKVAIRYGARSDEPGFHPERALLPGRRGRMENVQTAAAHFRRLVGGNKLHKGPRLGPAGPCETLAQACRHRRFGDSPFLVEPNIKEGRGGLRDMQTLYWIARATLGIA